MATDTLTQIVFTQCVKSFEMCSLSKLSVRLPVIPRIAYYKDVLIQHPTYLWHTPDELLLLVAQYLKRHGLLGRVFLGSVCNCGDNSHCDTLWVELDTEGD
jgi:hypothetical protein